MRRCHTEARCFEKNLRLVQNTPLGFNQQVQVAYLHHTNLYVKFTVERRRGSSQDNAY